MAGSAPQRLSGGLTQIGFGSSTQIGQAEFVAITGDVHGLDAASVGEMHLHIGGRSARVVGRAGQRTEPPRPVDLVGRETEIEALTAALGAGGLVAVTGAAGVGKTAVAASAIAGLDDTLVWWIPCSQPELVEPHLTGLADHLGIPASVPDLHAVLRTALGSTGPWVVVVDHCEDPDLIEPLLPTADGGTILATSRLEGWSRAREVSLGALAAADARRLVATAAGLDSPEEVAALVNVVGAVPEALVQAAAHLRTTGAPVDRYVQQLAEREGTAGGRVGLTLAEIEATDPSALGLLGLMAVLDHDAPVPLTLLERAAPMLEGPVASALADGIAADRCVGVLRGFGVVERDGNDIRSLPAVDVAASAALDPDAEAVNRRALLAATEHLLRSSATDPAGWDLVDRVLPHALELTRHPEAEGDRAAAVLARTAEHLLAMGEPERAVHLADRAAAVATDPATSARSLVVRGRAKGAAENDSEAIADLDAAIAASDDPAIEVEALAWASMAHGNRGDLRSAFETGLRSLDVLGTVPDPPPHLEVLALRVAGAAHGASGDLPAARATLERAARVPLSPGDLSGLSASLQLAAVQRAEGDVEVARNTVLDARDRVDPHLPATHAMHLWIATELGAVDLLTGRSEQTETAMTDLLEAGAFPTAMATANAHWLRAHARAQAGDLDQADADLTAAAALLADATPAGHPMRTSVVQARAALLAQRGDPGTAVAILDRAVDEAETVVGPDHTGVVAVRLQQAQCLIGANRAGEAVALLSRIQLPDGHPARPNTAFVLAMAQGQAGDLTEAVTTMRRSIELQADRFGPHHPSLSAGYAALARMLLMSGDPGLAREVAERGIADLVLADALDEPAAFEPLVVLAMTQVATDDPNAARARLNQAMELVERYAPPGTQARAQTLASLAVPWSGIDAGRAAAFVEESRDLLAASLGAHHPMVQQMNWQLRALKARAGAGGILRRVRHFFS